MAGRRHGTRPTLRSRRRSKVQDVSTVAYFRLRNGRAGAGQRASFNVGFKPAGGIATAKQAVTFLSLMKDELGDGYLNNHMFRFGASSLLTDIERQLHHQAEGSYAALHYMPMA